MTDFAHVTLNSFQHLLDSMRISPDVHVRDTNLDATDKGPGSTTSNSRCTKLLLLYGSRQPADVGILGETTCDQVGVGRTLAMARCTAEAETVQMHCTCVEIIVRVIVRVE